MKKILLALLLLPLVAGAQRNRFEEEMPIGLQRSLTVKAAGAERTFALDLSLAKSVTPTGEVLERLEFTPNHFVPRLETVKGTAPEGASGILGRDAFAGVVVTVFGDELLLTAPYKPAYMPLQSRADITPDVPLDSLLRQGVVTFDLPRGKYYFVRNEKLRRPSVSVSVKVEVTKTEAVAHLTTTDFLTKVADIRAGGEWKYLGDQPCVIDFWAPWCGPCLRMMPTVEALARESGDRLKVYKINIDEEPEIKRFFNVGAIPMFLFIPLEGAPKPVMGVSEVVLREEFEALAK